MNETNAQVNSNSVPLAKAFMLKELSGRIGKSIQIPPQRQGVALPAQGPARLLTPGRQRVLSAFERLLGRGAGLRVGYIPAQDFYLWLVGSNLLSGDEQLLDLVLLCRLEVADPQRFFLEVVLPRQGGVESILELDEGSLSRLGVVARNYAAEDLVSGLPTTRLLPLVLAGVKPQLANQGLDCLGAELLAFQRSEDRLLIAQKKLELDERLRQIELDRQMMEFESEQQWQDFLRQFDPQLSDHVALRPVGEMAESSQRIGVNDGIAELPASQQGEHQPVEDTASSSSEVENLPAPGVVETSKRPSPLEILRGWITLETRKLSGGRRWRIEALIKQAPPAEESVEGKHGTRQLQSWARHRFWAVLGIVLVGWVVSLVIVEISKAASWSSRWEILFVIWAPIAGFAFESLRAFLVKREELEQALWTSKNATYLDNLTRNNPRRIDALVRQQTSADLNHVSEMLNDLRARLYRDGQVDLALKTKRLEQKFAHSAEQVQNPKFGKPPYLDDLQIKGPVWEGQLDFDEQLLVISAALSEDGQAVQQSYAQVSFEPELLDQLEGRLDAFMHRFETRSWALKALDQDLKNHRMEAFSK